LIEALAATGDPDAAFTRFSTFFEGLPSGVQPLSLLVNQPELARELIAMLGLAPRLAEVLARRPALMDSLLDPAFARPLSEDPPAYRIERFSGLEGLDYEQALNAARRLAREEKLRIGGQLLLGRARAQDAGQAYADLADASLGAMAQAALSQMSQRHGPPPGDWAVLGLGKLGGRELSATSDLDIMLVFEPTAEASDGPRPLGAQTWFIRFTQRLVSALSAPTEEGELYDVDLALRPSGSAGPAAVSLSRFEEYYQTSEAWTWERMALTRSRMVVEGGLAARLDRAVTNVIKAAGPPDRLKSDAADMRARLERDRPARSPWDTKLRAGGLIDIEFIAQIGQLVLGERLGADTQGALDRLVEAGWLRDEDGETLKTAHELYADLTQILRAAHGADFDPDKASEPFAQRLCQAAHCDDLDCTADALNIAAARVRTLFERYIGEVTFAATE
jgi:glutamate-ammonia-ligase adenylyltransferase